MKKKLLALLLALTMAFTLAACGSGGEGGGDEASGDSIKVGLIGPVTGNNASFGNAMVEGARLTVEQINAAGGILGKQVELIEADDRGDPTECMNAFNNMVAEGVKYIIGSATSGATAAITSMANEEEIVLISPSATADDITTEDDYVFRACFKDSLQGDIAAAWVEQQGITKVGTIECSADTYSSGLVKSFTAACQARGIEVVAAESTATMDAQDFTNQFTSMVNAGAELVYAIYYYDAVGAFLVPQARAAALTALSWARTASTVPSTTSPRARTTTSSTTWSTPTTTTPPTPPPSSRSTSRPTRPSTAPCPCASRPSPATA